MDRNKLFLVAGAVLFVAAVLVNVFHIGAPHHEHSGPGAAEGGSAMSSEFDKQAENFLMQHPEVIIASIEKYQHDKTSKTEQQAQENINNNMPALFDDQSDPRVGPADAKVKIVEFFDYNCGYCKKMVEAKAKLINNDKVLFIFKELPIMGPNSELFSKYALAVNKLSPSKYLAFQTALLTEKVDSEAGVGEVLSKLSLDPSAVKAVANSEEITQKVSKNVNLAMQLGIRGTPAYIINTKLIPGYIDYDGIKKVIAETASK